MEITLLVSPGGSITFHCDHPFTHKLISLQEVEREIQSLIDQQTEEEKLEDEEDEWSKLQEFEDHLKEKQIEREGTFGR